MLKPRTPGKTAGAGVDEATFRSAMRRFASGVTVITTRDGARVHGMTATAFCSLSLRPPLVLVAVARESRSHALVQREGHFGVSILAADQADLSRHFGGAPNPETEAVFVDLGGVAVLDAAMVKLSCRLDEAVEGGDHSIFIGLVTEARTRPVPPLVHFDGRYHAVAPHRSA